MNEMQNKNKKEQPERIARKYRQKYLRTSKPLYKSILSCIPPLKNVKGEYDQEAVRLMIKAGELFDSFGTLSRKWIFSIHWLYTVCNPRIIEISNVKYSPIYENYATTHFPNDHFRELAHKDIGIDDGELVRHGNKLVADRRFVDSGVWDFGSSWSDDGAVINVDKDGHPVFDGFSGWVANNITQIQNNMRKNVKRDRRFQAFLIAHTRDIQLNVRNSEPEHKGSHLHGILNLPNLKSKYQIMEAMGVNFKDFEETFDWISNNGMADTNARTDTFLNSLEGIGKNYEKPSHYKSSLQYLVHQSSGALKNQKASYNTKEVLSWLPDDPGEDYEHLAGVYNNEVISEGMDSEIRKNLQSVYNTVHHTKNLVGKFKEKNMFTFDELELLRSLGKKQPGKLEFSKRSKDQIIQEIMKMIRRRDIEVNDIRRLIHAAFSDGDADRILADKNFINKLSDIIDDEVESILSDGSYDRNMLTIFISSKVGGIGKTRLAIELAKYFDKGRMPHQASAKDKDKTYDAYQNYHNESSSIIDEIDPSSISWTQWKDLFDPHKAPTISSRFNVKTPWNVHYTFLTNVYKDGIDGYIRELLHYAPGVGSLGYLNKQGNDWEVKTGDREAAKSYISQLSQLMRRIPVSIYMEPSDDSKGTRIVVSVINFKPGGRNISNYGYVHTEDSDHTFRMVINDSISDERLKYMTQQVAEMINDIRTKVKKTYEQKSINVLDESNGFISDKDYLGIYWQKGIPYLGTGGVEALF